MKDDLPKPPVPPENCCLSGCQHCVWDVYADELREYQEKIKMLKRTTAKDHPADGEDIADIDPSVKAFLDLEKYAVVARYETFAGKRVLHIRN